MLKKTLTMLACFALPVSLFAADAAENDKPGSCAVESRSIAIAEDTSETTAPSHESRVLSCIGNKVVVESFNDSFWHDANHRKAYLECFNAETGKKEWTYQTKGYIVSFTVCENRILIIRNYKHLTGIDLETGIELWRADTAGKYSTFWY